MKKYSALLLLVISVICCVSGQYSYKQDRSSRLLIQNPCVSKETCSKCIQTPTCAWCMQPVYNSTDGSFLPRCNQEDFYKARSRAQCEHRFIVNPQNEYNILLNKEYRKSSSSINESVFVNLEMLGQCNCEKPGNQGYEEKSPRCSHVGTYKCGICECPDGYYGQSCECSAMYLQFAGDLESGCRPDNTTSTVCNNRGDCICGNCDCHERENMEEQVTGRYCECDNFSCDRHNGLLCSGPDHGECVCGMCKCNSEWEVPGYTACECKASNETCITPYGEHIGKLCSGHGSCVCGECKCDEDDNGQYSGQFCEDCPTCPGKCQELKACVQCKQFQSGELHDVKDDMGVYECDKCPFTPIVVEKVEDKIVDKEISCTFLDDDDCRFTFVYGYRNDTGELQVWMQETKECPVVVELTGIVLGVIGAIVAICW